MKSLTFALIAQLLGGLPVAAAQNPACSTPFPAEPSRSPEARREIAASCADDAIALLFYGRAYHAEVLADLHRLQGLETYRASADRLRYEQSRMFVALAEALAERAWEAGDPRVIRALNRAYDQAIDRVELTLRGYDRLPGQAARWGDTP